MFSSLVLFSSLVDRLSSAMLSPMPRFHRKCQTCNALFEADHRNAERQRFCSKPDCQRERRRREQRLRRAQALERICTELRNDNPRAARRPQKASRVREALIDSQSPIVIGLVSMLIDSEDREEIAHALGKLWERGWKILNPQLGDLRSKPLPRAKIGQPAVEMPVSE